MPEKQRVAARRFPHDVGAQTLERPAEDRFYERNALLFCERVKLETLQVAVLPQRGDRVGNPFTATDCGHNVSGPVDRDLVQQCRG